MELGMAQLNARKNVTVHPCALPLLQWRHWRLAFKMKRASAAVTQEPSKSPDFLLPDLFSGNSSMKRTSSTKGTSNASVVGPVAQMGFAWAAQGACSSGTHLPVGFPCSVPTAMDLGADFFPTRAPLPWLPAARGEAAAIRYLWWIWAYYCTAFLHADSTASCGEIAAWWIGWERPGKRYYNTT